MARKPARDETCPCGSAQPYAQCCAPLHAGEPAPDAERLMRSRYSAYVKHLEAYLLATWAVQTRPATLDLSVEPQVQWLGLKVLAYRPVVDPQRDAQTAAVNAAEVEFVARYKLGGRAHRLHERSRFERCDGRWYYVSGEFPPD